MYSLVAMKYPFDFTDTVFNSNITAKHYTEDLKKHSRH